MKNKYSGYFYVITATTIWGSMYVVSKQVLGTIPPFTLLAMRYIVAISVLLAVIKILKLKKIQRCDYKYIFAIGFVGYFISNGTQFAGTRLAGASMASLLNSMNPVFITLFAMIFLHEKLTLSKAAALFSVLAGAYIIIGGAGSSDVIIEGIIISLSAVITWSLISILVKKMSLKYDAIIITTYAMIIALVFALPVSAYELSVTPGVNLFVPAVLLRVVYIGIVATAIAHVFWNKSLSLMEASTCSLFYPLQPTVSILLGSLLLGEKLGISFFIGAVLVVAGVLINVLSQRRKQS